MAKFSAIVIGDVRRSVNDEKASAKFLVLGHSQH